MYLSCLMKSESMLFVFGTNIENMLFMRNTGKHIPNHYEQYKQPEQKASGNAIMWRAGVPDKGDHV